MPAVELENMEYLQTQVNERTKHDFEEACRQLEIRPDEPLREFVTGFLDKHRKMLGDIAQIRINHLPGYEHGAWKIEMTLDDSIKSLPLPFHFPKLPNRSIHGDPEYKTVLLSHAGDDHEIGGLFMDRIWRGRVYTFGITEDANPTSIEDVREAFKKTPVYAAKMTASH